MPFKKIEGIPASRIAELVGGEIRGEGSVLLRSVTAIEDAAPGALCFLREKSSIKDREAAISSKASALLLSSWPTESTPPPGKVLIVVPKPLDALVKCVPIFFEPYKPAPGISPLASVDPSAKIGGNVSIGAFAVIGAFAEIGADSVIHPHVVLYPGARIGPRAVIHSGAVIREESELGADTVVQNGAVIGADGFGYIPDPKLGLVSVPQIGRVKLADRVEVGANACIDRATLGSTAIGLGTKIDNLVQVGHNTRIGSFSILCGQTGVAGSCEIGDQVVMGGNAGIADHLTIASGVRLAAKSGVTHSLLEKGDYGGYPALPVATWRRSLAVFRKLPQLAKLLRDEKD